VPKDKNRAKKYIAIVKIKNNIDGTAHCVKYRFDDLIKFTNFLDREWPEWKWYNVYSNAGNNKRNQIGNFTKYNRPVSKSI
jgi:hypothetical protein